MTSLNEVNYHFVNLKYIVAKTFIHVEIIPVSQTINHVP